jgi:drug/metabolite transporter (DMT)-like permease
MHQCIGVLVNIAGVVFYFHPVSFPAEQIVVLIVMLVGVFANAGASILGRRINRENDIPALVVTTISMGVGAVVLLVTGISTERSPCLERIHWAIIGWLAVVNTALAFTLWNRTLRVLPAVESSIINNTMRVQVAVLSWRFLDESLGWREIVGIVLAGLGTLLVQIRRPKGLNQASGGTDATP